MKEAPQIKKSANKEAPAALTGMAYRYERAYQSLLSKESKQMQERILDVRTNPDIRDHQVDAFIDLVRELAEGDAEL